MLVDGLGGEEGTLTDDETCEATGWVVRTLLLPLLEAAWQGEGLSILREWRVQKSVVPRTGRGCGPRSEQSDVRDQRLGLGQAYLQWLHRGAGRRESHMHRGGWH